MLKVLRKKGVMKKLLWLVAGVIIIVFGFLGESYLLNDPDRSNDAGRVFGKSISSEEFQRSFKNTQIQAMIQYGDNFNKIKQFLNLESEAWDRVILLHEAKRRKIKIANKEVVNTIQGYKFFQRDGQFDRMLYNDILRYAFRIQPRDFEESIRESLSFAFLYKQETSGITVPQEEIRDAYKRENEKIQVSYILFADEKYKDRVTFDDIQAKNYYLAHKSEFQFPPMINVEYIRIDYPEGATPGENEKMGDEQTDKPQDVGAQQKAATKIKARKISDDLLSNPDFEKIAEENNLTIETSGFFSMEKPNLKEGWSFGLIQELFNRNAGYINEPIQTAKGYQILKIKEKKDTYIPEYEGTKEKVKEAWINSESKKLSGQEAAKQLKVIQEIFEKQKRPDFTKIAKTKGFEIHQTPVFSQGQYLPRIGISREFTDSAFTLSDENKLSNVVSTSIGSCILHLDSRESIDEEEYEKKKEEFTEKLLTQKKNTAFNNFLTRLRLKANPEKTIQ